MIFETERLLRLIKQDDAQGIVGYASEPNMGSKQHESLDETLEIMETVLLNQENGVWNCAQENGQNGRFHRVGG